MTEVSKTELRSGVKGSTVEGSTDKGLACPELEDSAHQGFVTDLFYACLENVTALKGDKLPKGHTKRLQRSLIRDVHEKLFLLQDVFEHGKIESCLSVDGDLHQQVTALLYEIGKAILKGDTVRITRSQTLNEDAVHGRNGNASIDPLKLNLEQQLLKAKQILEPEGSDEESTSTTDGSDSASILLSRGLSKAELQSLKTHVGLLMDLCPTLEQAYRDQHSERPPRSNRVTTFHVTPAAIPYVQLVRDKFPLADSLLIERLGEANWQRHQRLRYAEISECQFQPVSLFKDSALGSSLGPAYEKAPTVASHSSFVSSTSNAEKGRFRVPKLPADARYGESFLCCYCKQILHTINTRVDWKLHVFADLQAYICFASDCPESLKLFASRKAWFDHISTHHLSRHEFHCQSCPSVLDSENDFVSHSFREHQMDIDAPHLRAAILATARRPHLQQPEKLQCPLCHHQNFCSTHRDFATHVGRELEEVALSALPPQEDSESESESEGAELPETEDEDRQSKSEAGAGYNKQKLVEYRYAVSLLVQIRREFAQQREINVKIEDILKSYPREWRSFQEFSSKVKQLFSSDPDMAKRFEQILPETEGDLTNLDIIFCDSPSG